MISKVRSVVSYFFIEGLGSVVYFPVWWYTKGWFGVLGSFGQALRYRWLSYGFRIWLKNFFVPMYGQHDWSGRLVSILIRFFVLVGRLIAFCIEALVYFVLAVAWIIALPLFLFFFVWTLL